MSDIQQWLQHNKSVAIAWAGCLLYAIYVIVSNDAVAEPLDWVSIFTEGCLALMPATALFLISRLKHQSSVYNPLLLGLSLILLALITDTLDEFVQMPDLLNGMVEGFFQVIGYALLLVGIKRLVDTDISQKKHLHHLATTDPLTGIANRRHFVDSMALEISRINRYQGHFH